MNHWTITRNRPQTVRFPGGQREEARPYASSLVLRLAAEALGVLAVFVMIGAAFVVLA